MVDPNEHNELTVPGALAESANPGVLATPAPAGDLAGAQPANEFMTEDAAYDPLAGATSGKKMKGGFLLLMGVILVAVAGLFSMRKLAHVTAASGIDKEIEETIEDFLRSMARRESGGEEGGSTGGTSLNLEALSVITQSYSERQIALNDVQRDPFIIDDLDNPDVVETPITGLDPAELRERQRTKLRDQLTDAGKALRLKSIIGGSSPMALIDDDIVHIGDTVSDHEEEFVFRVSAISATSVDLVAEVSELDLVVTITLTLKRDR